MVSGDSEKILDLVKRSNDEGIKISFEDGDIALRFQKGKKVRADLLDELRQHKSLLFEYFGQYTRESLDERVIFEANEVRHEANVFYKTTSVEQYWVNADTDKEYKESEPAHGICLMVYEVSGELDLQIFKKACNYVTSRHESLRTTFHRIGQEYLMSINNDEADVEFIDLTGTLWQDDTALKAIVQFDGHKFNFEKGPLLLVRLIKIEGNSFIISVKAHHVIMDTLSEEVFFRDLSEAYIAFSRNQQPELPVLELQHKEYLAMANFHRSNNRKQHEEYWSGVCTSLPPDLSLPWARKVVDRATERICKTYDFGFPGRLINKLDLASKDFAVSRFIVLQAAFNYFLLQRTGQNDVVIGTYIYGRDYPGQDEQIGCYAKTILIRTTLGHSDSFATVIRRVQQSNEDAKNYNAYTLFDAFSKFLASRNYSHDAYWKVNILYNDYSSGSARQSPTSASIESNLMVQPLAKFQLHNNRIDRDLQLQFTKHLDSLHLHVQYDSGRYDHVAIETLVNDFVRCLEEIDME